MLDSEMFRVSLGSKENKEEKYENLLRKIVAVGIKQSSMLELSILIEAAEDLLNESR